MSIPHRLDWSHVPGAPDPATVAGVGTRGLVEGPHGPSLAPPPKGQPIVFPWWLWEMPGSADWELNALNFTATASATTTVPGFSLVVGKGNVGVLTMLTATVLNPTTTLDLRFRLLVDGGPIVGWTNIYIPPLNATAFVKDYNGIVIRLSENQTLTAAVIEASGANFTCSLQARGWTTPKNVVQQFMSGIPY